MKRLDGIAFALLLAAALVLSAVVPKLDGWRPDGPLQEAADGNGDH